MGAKKVIGIIAGALLAVGILVLIIVGIIELYYVFVKKYAFGDIFKEWYAIWLVKKDPTYVAPLGCIDKYSLDADNIYCNTESETKYKDFKLYDSVSYICPPHHESSGKNCVKKEYDVLPSETIETGAKTSEAIKKYKEDNPQYFKHRNINEVSTTMDDDKGLMVHIWKTKDRCATGFKNTHFGFPYKRCVPNNSLRVVNGVPMCREGDGLNGYGQCYDSNYTCPTGWAKGGVGNGGAYGICHSIIQSYKYEPECPDGTELTKDDKCLVQWQMRKKTIFD